MSTLRQSVAAPAAYGHQIESRRHRRDGPSDYRRGHPVAHGEDGLELFIAVGAGAYFRLGAARLGVQNGHRMAERRGAGVSESDGRVVRLRGRRQALDYVAEPSAILL